MARHNNVRHGERTRRHRHRLSGKNRLVSAALGLGLFILTFITGLQHYLFSTTTTTTSSTDHAVHWINALPREDVERANDLIAQHASEYTWRGNVFVPPPGSDLATPAAIASVFQHESVLFLGDSTLRRAALTLYGLLNHTVHQSEDNNTVQHVPTAVLDGSKVIDVNRRKDAVTETCHQWKSLADKVRTNFVWSGTSTYPDYLPPKFTESGFCRTVPQPRRDGRTTTTTTTTTNSSLAPSTTIPDKKPARFDYIRINCFKDLHLFKPPDDNHHHSWWDFSNRNRHLFHDAIKHYSLVVVGLGIWEAIGDPSCEGVRHQGRLMKPQTPDDLHVVQARLRAALDILEHHVRSPTTRVLWRTMGFTKVNKHVYDNRVAWLLNAQAKRTITTDHRAGLDYVDWGAAVWPRSVGKDRMEGDVAAHYGLVPRLLLVQMLTDKLLSWRTE